MYYVFKIVVLYIFSGFIVGPGGKVNLVPVTPSWKEVKPHTTLGFLDSAFTLPSA